MRRDPRINLLAIEMRIRGLGTAEGERFYKLKPRKGGGGMQECAGSCGQGKRQNLCHFWRGHHFVVGE